MHRFIQTGLAGFLALFACCALASDIWFSAGDALYRLNPGSNQTTLVASPGSAQGLAVDAKDGSAWTLLGSQVLKLSESGVVLSDIDLKSFGIQQPAGFLLDPFNSSLWLADGNALAHLDAAGRALGSWQVSGVARSLSPGVDGSVWLLGNKQLWHYSPQGVLLASQDLHALVREATKFLAADSLGNAIWLAGEKELVQLDLSSLTQVRSTLTTTQVILGLALDAKHGVLWVLTNDAATGFTRDGSTVKTIALGVHGVTKPVTLAFDATSDCLWLGHDSGLLRFTSGGEPAGSLSTAKPVSAVGTAPFVLSPSVSILKPPENALTNNARPEFLLNYDALCSGVSCGFASSYFSSYSLTALLNNQPVGSQFVFDPNTGHAGYTPLDRLPEGSNNFTAQVRDGFGQDSNSVSNLFIVDTIAPAFLTISPANGSVVHTPQVLVQGTVNDLNATIVLEELGLTQSGANFAFPVVLAPGLNSFTLSAVDRAGNSATVMLNLTQATVGLSIETPANGSFLGANTLLVSGTFQGPPNTGISANSVIAAINGNRFYAQVPLVPGINTITVTVTSPDGHDASQTVSVTSGATSSINVAASSTYILAPAMVTFELQNASGRTIKRTEVDYDGNGSVDIATTDPNAVLRFTYATPGLYTAAFRMTDDQDTIHDAVVVIQAENVVWLDQLLRGVWSSFAQALLSRDKSSAMNALSVAAREIYEPVYDTLEANLPAIAASFSTLQDSTISSTVGEYAVNRTVDGIERIFFVYFLRDLDGVWRIDSM